MLAAHVHKTPDILDVVVLCRAEDLNCGTVIGVWVPEEDPYDVSAARNISERETRVHIDPKVPLLLLTCIGPARASPTYASHKVTRPMAITR